MKCRHLRRRYVTFKVRGAADDSSIIAGMARYLPPDGRAKVILRDGSFVIVRIDQIALMNLKHDFGIPIALSCGNSELTSVFAAGSVKKSRERIKAHQE